MLYLLIENLTWTYIEMKFLLFRAGDQKTNEIQLANPPLSHPPLGLLYLGAILEQEGHKVEIIDCYAEKISREKLENYLQSSDAVGMNVHGDDYIASANISKMIKEIEPDIPLIIGGPNCTFCKERALNDISHADVSVIGEGEHVILDLVKYLQGKKKLLDIPGIYYRDNGSIKSGKPLKVIDNLDNIPFPARHLVDKYEYGDFPFGYQLKKKVTSIITSRGCPFRCRFCPRYSNIIEEWGFRQRSVENVVKEIQELDDKYRSVWIVDDNFLADTKRTHKIFDKLLEIGIEIDLLIEGARADSADRELYKKMKKAGVTFISYGIESGNQDILDFYNKKITLQQIQEATSLAREMGFFLSASFIIGAPIESKQHIENTIRYACSLPLDIASFAPLRYVRGSKLWLEAVENEKISSDIFMAESDSRKGLGNFTREELIAYAIQAHKTFYFRPIYLFSQIYRSLLRNNYSLLFHGLKFLFALKGRMTT
jgi:radical SAM superfamily enzyme YgiQ (UPF0313 family)